MMMPLCIELMSVTLGHKFVKPRAIHDAEIVEELAKDYLYFSCIKFINSVSEFVE